MERWLSEKDFNDALMQRVIDLRLAKDWTQAEMASALGVPHENYKKYEQRMSLPAFLIPRVASISDWDIQFIVTGVSSSSRRRGPRVLVRTGTDG